MKLRAIETANGFMESLGAALIQKPYNVEVLGRKVREVLDARRQC